MKHHVLENWDEKCTTEGDYDYHVSEYPYRPDLAGFVAMILVNRKTRRVAKVFIFLAEVLTMEEFYDDSTDNDLSFVVKTHMQDLLESLADNPQELATLP